MAQRALGKGLASLISDDTLEGIQQAYIPNLPISKIVPNQHQPRIEMNPEKLVELSDSIRELGIIEPLIVTQSNPGEYELIAGERRWRAAKLAGLKKVPVVVKEASPQQMLELAIVENIQREDLNPLEEAMAFEHLAKKFNVPHAEIARKVGYSRPAVANKIRLLQLPDDVKKGLIDDKLSEGHARSLLGLKNEQTILAAFRIIIRDGLSVRATEKLVQKLNTKKTEVTQKEIIPISSKLVKIESDFKKRFNSKTVLSIAKNGKGRILIPFESQEELEQIHTRLQ